MSDFPIYPTKLPPEQQAIQAKCFHPTGIFVEFEQEEIEQSIPERFEKIVRQHPKRIAVKTHHHSLTYDELNKAANRIARAILACAGEGQEPVALLFEHGASIVAAILGILKAGKIYVSLDPAFPQTRAGRMLEDSQAKLLLTNTKHLFQGQQLVCGGQYILNCDDVDDSMGSGNLDRRLSSETGALILYTSGSTGHPKGVLHNHRHILVEMRNYTNDVRICLEDKLALCQSCSFALSLRNLYGALLNGATLFPYDLATEGVASLADWLVTNQISILHLPGTAFRGFLADAAPDTVFSALRVLRLGAEPINSEDVKLFHRHFSSNCVLLHAIGPSETGTIRRHFITHAWAGSDSKVPVGYAVPDKEILLLDETGRELGVDQIGEIAVRSKYLALGYWRRPDLTQAAFSHDPSVSGERLFLTGDLGVMRADGCLMHMGRKDFQVKVRGYRVEVAEIEAALVALDAIKAAVVHPQPDDTGETRLVAYVVPAAGEGPTVSELRRALAQILPNYMLPSAYVFLDALPVLTNGKVDRRALPLPDQDRPRQRRPYAAPQNGVEHELIKIWEEVLHVRPIGIDDSFFDLGGDSLTATRVVSRVVKKFQLKIPLPSLFQSPTVAEMAAVITQHQGKQLVHEELERIVTELESMSEEQAKQLLTDHDARGTRD